MEPAGRSAAAAGPSGAPRALRDRETQGRWQRWTLPAARGGVLVLDEGLDLASLPIRPLDAYAGEQLHYIDLAGTQARSLADFGGDPATLRHVTKLYASRCGLTSLEGLEAFPALRYLYLDQNQLSLAELQRAATRLDGPLLLEALDLAGNPAAEPACSGALLALLLVQAGQRDRLCVDCAQLRWLNGRPFAASDHALGGSCG